MGIKTNSFTFAVVIACISVSYAQNVTARTLTCKNQGQSDLILNSDGADGSRFRVNTNPSLGGNDAGMIVQIGQGEDAKDRTQLLNSYESIVEVNADGDIVEGQSISFEDATFSSECDEEQGTAAWSWSTSSPSGTAEVACVYNAAGTTRSLPTELKCDLNVNFTLGNPAQNRAGIKMFLKNAGKPNRGPPEEGSDEFTRCDDEGEEDEGAFCSGESSDDDGDARMRYVSTVDLASGGVATIAPEGSMRREGGSPFVLFVVDEVGESSFIWDPTFGYGVVPSASVFTPTVIAGIAVAAVVVIGAAFYAMKK